MLSIVKIEESGKYDAIWDEFRIIEVLSYIFTGSSLFRVGNR